MIYFDPTKQQDHWFNDQLKSLLIFMHNLNATDINKETLSDCLDRIIKDTPPLVRAENHDRNEQIFFDCQYSRFEYKSKPLSILKLRLKNDKKMRQLTDNLRPVFSLFS